jgi:hypothetical protein
MTDEPTLAEHLRSLEAELVRPEVWQSREELEARMTPDFVEFASEGRIYDRSALVAELFGKVPPPIQVENFTVRELGPEVALVTSLVIGRPASEPPAIALRSSAPVIRLDQGLLAPNASGALIVSSRWARATLDAARLK